MKPKSRLPELHQNLVTSCNSSVIKQFVIREEKISQSAIEPLGQDATPLGLSVGYCPRGQLETVCFIDSRARCVIVLLNRDKPAIRSEKMALLQKYIFCREAGEIYAFNMLDTAISLLSSLDLHLCHAVNVESAFRDHSNRIPAAEECIRAVVGETAKLSTGNIKRVFANIQRDAQTPVDKTYSDLTQRAWVAQYIATFENAEMTFGPVNRIDTTMFDSDFIQAVISSNETTRQVSALQPKTKTHQFTKTSVEGSENVSAEMGAFSNRFHRNQELRIEQETASGDRITRVAKSTIINGKSGNIAFDAGSLVDNNSKTITKIVSTSASGPTRAELETKRILLEVLEGNVDMFRENVWVRNIIMRQGDDLVWPPEWTDNVPPPTDEERTLHESHPARQHLNESQQTALDHMLSRQDPVTIVQGPPGTGKTSVIAAYVQTALDLGQRGIWLVAQSNVAVKNIAEKLLKVKFVDFRLLVSTDFKDGWHDHLYSQIQPYIIQSSEFIKLPSHRIKGVKVFLCTLSMLASPSIQQFIGPSRVPVKALVIDEASQIKVPEYIHVFNRFKNSLNKMCFIGDPRQLPPFGADDVEELHSIFEVDHLKKLWLLLNTQYRMPPQLGKFISSNVYDNQLKSWDNHPIASDIKSVYLIDAGGRERKNAGNSFENNGEVDIILQLAEILQLAGSAFKIITPYDGQRNLIEQQLQQHDLDWKDKCFNVDSFQGNEEDFIIISVVRSQAIGFLKSLRRTNVMLTRCKRGMYIVANKSFITSGGGRESLVGRLAESLGEDGWTTTKMVEGKMKEIL